MTLTGDRFPFYILIGCYSVNHQKSLNVFLFGVEPFDFFNARLNVSTNLSACLLDQGLYVGVMCLIANESQTLNSLPVNIVPLSLTY